MNKCLSHLVLVLFALLTVSCKAVNNLVYENVLAPAFIPFTNQDLLMLQGSLFHYKKMHGNWPAEVKNVIDIKKDDSIKVNFEKFKVLNWAPAGDALFVNYWLHYNETDSIEYSYLSGRFYLLPGSDTLAVIHYYEFKGRKKDGSSEFAGKDLKLKINGPILKD